MKVIRDFLCSSCGTVSEAYVDTEFNSIECPECHGDAVRQLSMPMVKLEGVTGDFPGAFDRWARIREENAKIKAKKNS